MKAGRRHLFLTGERRVGKSTILRRVIERRGLRCSGFETRPLMIGGERRGYLLHVRVPKPADRNDTVACLRVTQQRMVPVLPVFEENGAAILRASLIAPEPFILMDELGRLERDAAEFCTQVLACLDSEKRVIGVLQQCDAPLIDAIRARDDVQVLTVTEENRDAICAMLCEDDNWKSEDETR